MTIFNWAGDVGQRSPAEELSPTIVPRIQTTTAPASEPVTAAELADLLKVSQGDEGAVLTKFLEASRARCEVYTGRVFISRICSLWLDFFPPARIINLPISPVSAIASVAWFDEDDVEAAVDSADYVKDLVGSPARVAFKRAFSFPGPLRVANGLRVNFTAGYGAATDVPEAIKKAIRLTAAEMYEARGTQRENGPYTPSGVLPADALALLDAFRVVR